MPCSPVTLVLGAAYTLWLVKRVIFGAVANDDVAELKDLDRREFLVLGVLALACCCSACGRRRCWTSMRPTIEQLVQQIDGDASCRYEPASFHLGRACRRRCRRSIWAAAICVVLLFDLFVGDSSRWHTPR